MSWIKVLKDDIPLQVMTKQLPTKGNLVYEYNPFRNYRLSSNKYYYNNDYYSLKEMEDNYNLFLYWINEDGKLEKWDGQSKPIGWATTENNKIVISSESPELYEKGQLIDFITDELSFSLDHPVHIIPQASYDGSVNLIINDGINLPRLINSRFSATGKNTYEIVDRKGNNDTNIYDSGEQFDIDTSLYKRIIKIPKIDFKGVSAGGNLRIGNYHFYFKLADADGNETDFVGESGLVSVFIGFNDPDCVTSGQKNENSYKQVEFQLSNLDSAYSNVTVYYSRYTAEAGENYVTEYIKIKKNYLINNFGIANISITGFEQYENVAATDINLMYNTVDAVHTSAVCQNMLFLGNVHKPDIPYVELQDLSLRFLPYLEEEQYPLIMDQEYYVSSNNKGYYDPKFIYDKTGYWPNEIYRFGVVYILPNNELSPVFNIRGGCRIKPFSDSEDTINDGQFSDIPIWKNGERQYINYNEETYTIINNDDIGTVSIENVKGVCRFENISDKNTIFGVNIRASKELINELKKYVKGYFFVRQTRIPTVLAQGITIGIDKESGIPCLPTVGGVIDDINQVDLDKTYIETKDLKGLNYISEGFLTRYKFTLKPKNGWLKLLSGLLQAFASVCSFIPGIGTIASIAVNAASFILTTAITGKFATSQLVGTVLTAAVPGLKALEVAIKAKNTAEAIAASKALTKTLEIIKTVNDYSKQINNANNLTRVFNGVQGTMNTVEGTKEAISEAFDNPEYKGRNTDIPEGFKKVEVEDSRKVGGEFADRIIIKDSSKVTIQGIICPDYTLNQPYYNQIFTGNEHLIRYTKCQGINFNNIENYKTNYFTSNYRHFYHPDYFDYNIQKAVTSKVIGIADNVKALGLENKIFRSRAGEAEEAWRYESVGKKYESSTEIKENSDIVRGSFSPYLAINNEKLDAATVVDIMIPGYSESNINEYFYVRMIDQTPFNAISPRYDIHDQKEQWISYENNTLELNDNDGYQYHLYRGDCYLCQYTQRINRNFNDPSAPYNDEIVDSKTWKDNYDPDNIEKYNNVNLGDVNAVELGMWLTFRLRSSNNLNIRTADKSYVDEQFMTGHPRGYFPYQPMSTEGTFKHPESQIYNKGFNKSVSERWNIQVPDVPHIKNWFGTRIMYSDIHINDAYKNGFRVFQGTNYRDYTREYGEIVKLISLESNLLCVFEHGIALIPVNERAVAGQGAGGNVYINTSNVLPENPKIISDMFGSQWPESVLKVPGKTGDAPQYVYGVDTVAKKIWRTDGNTIQCISDFKVQEFLNNNITLGERELTPKIGIRNVKTHYNAFKRDVMFTFYDNTYGFEEKVWNLCWNELLQKFITFYSWVPSYMENINNVPFSFNRDTSKWIAKLGTSHTNSSFADGITLSNVIIEDTLKDDGAATNNLAVPIKYLTKDGTWKILNATAQTNGKYIGYLSLSNRVLPDAQLHYRVDYSLERDIQNNYKMFEILPLDVICEDGSASEGGIYTLPSDAMYPGAKMPLYALYFKDNAEDEYQPIYCILNNEVSGVYTELGEEICTYQPLYSPEALYSELYYRNTAGNVYADYDYHKIGTTSIITNNVPQEWIENEEVLARLEQELPPETVIGNTSTKYNRNNPPETVHPCTNLGEIRGLITYRDGVPMVHGIRLDQHWTVGSVGTNSNRKVWYDLPIFKDITGKRPTLPADQQVNPERLVTLLNIKATITIVDSDNSNVTLGEDYQNMKAGYAAGTSLIDAGYYESVVAIAPKWNLQFLSTDFWKHGQAGIIDIADDIKPTYWYGKQHPFEFECVVVNDPSVHKIFDNLELVANKAKPESFHYEIVGESYDFAKDKVNMYFRQEAMKALWQYNGADICYDRNFLKVQPRQQAKSADLPHKYYTRQDTINNIEDNYISITYPQGYDYRHLSGAEIVYYPNRQEYRIWNHAKAISLDDLSQDDSRSIITANCKYLEDRWKVTINPILICYKNEYSRKISGLLTQPANSTWTSVNRPKLPVMNSPIPDKAYQTIVNNEGLVEMPKELTNLGYTSADIDTTNWLSDVGIYNTNFGDAQNRKELDLKDKFMKVRIRYSGEELAVIDFLNTIYRVSYS